MDPDDEGGRTVADRNPPTPVRPAPDPVGAGAGGAAGTAGAAATAGTAGVSAVSAVSAVSDLPGTCTASRDGSRPAARRVAPFPLPVLPRWERRLLAPPAKWVAVAVVGVVVAVTALGAAASPTPAGADTSGAGAGGGTVSVGVGSGGGSGGSAGSGGMAGGVPVGGGGGSPWSCTYTYLALNNQGGFPPGGPQPGAWYSVTCVDSATAVQVTQTVWVTGAAPAGTPAVDPRSLALQAENSISLPDPTLRLDPSGTSVVGLATWLWIDGAIWHDESVTATAGPVSATAVARPVAVRWTTGDGSVVVCRGPGTPYSLGLPAALQATDCAHEYVRTSAGQPALDGNSDNGAFVVTATVEWSVTWTSVGVAGGGALPTLYTSGAALLRVAQVESVNTVPTVSIRGRTPTNGFWA